MTLKGSFIRTIRRPNGRFRATIPHRFPRNPGLWPGLTETALQAERLDWLLETFLQPREDGRFQRVIATDQEPVERRWAQVNHLVLPLHRILGVKDGNAAGAMLRLGQVFKVLLHNHFNMIAAAVGGEDLNRGLALDRLERR